ncbi:MAG: ferritin [Deltaproteobacteria bacterium]|nr:ferritin [Deltaproteobacteria bacterium]MBW2305753.1 ferritin [Deltaproteobacteria bacterium]
MPRKSNLNDMLNKAIAREISVSIQYMWHHVMAKGINAPPVQDIFKEIAIVEMKHAEEIAERLDYLGGEPTTKPDPISVGGTLKQMITADKKAEEEAIRLYKQIVKAAREAEDHTTRRLFERILADEEEHHNEFSGLLE